MAVLYLKYVDTSIPILFHGLLCVAAYLIWTFFAMLIVPFMTLFRFAKMFEYALISYRKIGTVFSTLDLPFLYESDTNRNFIIAMLEMKGKPNIKKIRRNIYNKLFSKQSELDGTYRRLSQYVRRCYWSYLWTDEENFCIKQHVPILKRSMPNNKKDLEHLYRKLESLPLPKNISPWKFYIIPKENKNEFVIFCKIHHVIGDGFAMIGLLSQLTDEKPKLISPTKARKGFTSDPFKRAISGVITGPLALLALAFSIKVPSPFFVKGPSKSKNVAWTAPLCLNAVKKIKATTDSTVNDVLISCLAGAIRKYLNAKGEAPCDLPIAMTYNSRSLMNRDINHIPLGNHSGGLFVNLPISISNPITRLDKTKSFLDKSKKSSHPHVFSFIYFKIIGCLPEIFGRLASLSIRNHTSMICSNVPGPIDKLHILGYPVESIVCTPPLHANIGLTVSIFSYNNQFKLSLLTDESSIPNPSEITNLFEKEVELLSNLLLKED